MSTMLANSMHPPGPLASVVSSSFSATSQQHRYEINDRDEDCVAISGIATSQQHRYEINDRDEESNKE